MAHSIRMDGLAWAMLLGLSLLWGLSFPFAEIALTGLPVLTVVALRVALATVTLWFVVFTTGAALPRTREVWVALGVMGLINNVIPFSLIVWGQTEITAGLAAVLNATTPLFAGLLAGALLADERLTAARLAGLLFGLAGVVVIVGPGVLEDLGAHVFAQLAILGAALSYGVSVVFGRRFSRLGVRPLVISAGQTLSSTLVLVPAALLIDHPFALPMPGLDVWLAVVAFAIPGTALAYILYFAILARAGATNAAIVTVINPVVAILVGAVALGEVVTLRQIGGMALIALGLSVLDGRLWRRMLRPAPDPAAPRA